MEIHQSCLYKPVINIFGSPHSGKSVLASYVFSMLKSEGINAEKAEEVAKDFVYEKNKYKIWCQPKVFGDQLYRQIRLIEDADVIVTDSPLLLACTYTPDCFNELEHIVKQSFSYFNNYCYFLPVFDKGFNQKGRRHSKKQCLELSSKIKDLMYECVSQDKILELKTHDLLENYDAIYNHANLERFV